MSLDEMTSLLQHPDGILWVSLEHATDDDVQRVLGGVFHFHPLTIEDCLSTSYQVPKVDDFGDYIFLVVRAVGDKPGNGQLDSQELDLYLGKHYLVTCYRSAQMSPIERVWHRLGRDERVVDRGADFLCHAVLDALVDEYLPLLDNMEDDIDRLEDEVLARPQTSALQGILALKHRILALRRLVGPQREVMNRLSRDDLPQIKRQNRIYFRDIYDHLVRIQDLSEAVRDVVGGTLDTYLSVTSNRLNEVMKALTVVSTLFLPLTFLAGVYGMNFRFMPEINWRYGYLVAWALFVGIAAFMLAWFRRRGWL